ncbi:MAG: hypothetical protein MJ066_04370 [Clostridia bacterium]|nr:hypothetical protein [Clostridia bacterium]
MNFGFVKCGVFTPNVKIADVCYNEKSIIDGIDKANEKGVEILVFPKLCLTGYTSGDLFYLDTLLSGALLSLNNIKEYTKGKNVVVFISLPIKKDGKLYLGNVCLFNGNILGIEVKSPSGNYERRYYNDYIGIDKINLFNEEVSFGKGMVFYNKEKNYKIAISQNRLLSNLSADIVIDLSADEEIALKKEKRINEAKSLSDILNCA